VPIHPMPPPPWGRGGHTSMAADRTETRVYDPAEGGPRESCLVTIYGPELGRKFPVDRPEVRLGRSADNEIVVSLRDVSRHHCVFHLDEGDVYLQDLGSTNGTLLNGKELRANERILLCSGDHIKVGGAIFKFLGGSNVDALYHEEIYRMMIVDGLAEIYNRRYFLEYLDREITRCRRYERGLSVMLIDIDRFAEINQRFGHLAGDAVIRELARRIKVRVRKESCFARYGGDELALALPEIDLENARTFGERILGLAADSPVEFEGRRIPVSVSIGIAALNRHDADAEAFLRRAEEHLHEAKADGRGCVRG